MSLNSRDQEVAMKLKRVRSFMEAEGLEAIILGRRDDFAWLTAGGDNHVAYETEVGVASLVITADHQYVVTANIEVERILREEVPVGFEPLTHPWHESPDGVLGRLVGGASVAADYSIPGVRVLGRELVSMRGSLTDWEVERYRSFAPVVAGAVEGVCREMEPGMTEHAVEARTIQALAERGFAFPVILVGADERITQFRHPIPTGHFINKRCMVVVCAQSRGLTVALTRIVQFGPMPDDLRRRHDAVVRVDAALIVASRRGRGYAEVLSDGIAAYEAAGFGGEWQNHHQGGPIGYQTREFLVTPGTRERIVAPQAIAWNPSVAGTKSEDTILVTEDGVEVITRGPGDWPMVSVAPKGSPEAVFRPDVLCR